MFLMFLILKCLVFIIYYLSFYLFEKYIFSTFFISNLNSSNFFLNYTISNIFRTFVPFSKIKQRLFFDISTLFYLKTTYPIFVLHLYILFEFLTFIMYILKSIGFFMYIFRYLIFGIIPLLLRIRFFYLYYNDGISRHTIYIDLYNFFYTSNNVIDFVSFEIFINSFSLFVIFISFFNLFVAIFRFFFNSSLMDYISIIRNSLIVHGFIMYSFLFNLYIIFFIYLFIFLFYFYFIFYFIIF